MKQNNASSALAPDRALDVRFMEFRSTRVASAPPRDCSSVIASAVQRGDLWNARRRALAHCLRPPETDVPALGFLTAARSAPPAPPSFDDDCGRQCARAWSSAIEELFAQPDHLRRIRRTHRRHFRRQADCKPRGRCSSREGTSEGRRRYRPPRVRAQERWCASAPPSRLDTVGQARLWPGARCGRDPLAGASCTAGSAATARRRRRPGGGLRGGSGKGVRRRGAKRGHDGAAACDALCLSRGARSTPSAVPPCPARG